MLLASHLGAVGVEEPQWWAGQGELSEHRVLHVHQQALARGLVPAVHLVDLAHLAGGDAHLGQSCEQRLGVPVREDLLHDRDDSLAVGDAFCVRRQPLGERVDGEALAEPAPQSLAAHRDLHRAVAAVEQAVRADRGVVVALCLPDLAGDGPAGALEGMHSHGGREQRGPHDRADAGAGPFVQGREHPVGAVHPGQQIGDRNPHPLRVLGTGAGQRHQSGLALRDLVVARAPTLGAVVTEPGHGQHHEARVSLLQELEAQPESVEHAGPEVLDEHVSAVDQLQQYLAIRLVLEVERDGLLVAVGREEVRRLPVVLRPDERRPPATGVVAVSLRLDLDHAGARGRPASSWRAGRRAPG